METRYLSKARKADAEDITRIGNTFQTFPLQEEVEEWIEDPRHCVVAYRLYDSSKPGPLPDTTWSELIGFAIGIRQSRSWMMVESFFVSPDYRRQGIGKKLYDFFLESLPKDVDFLTTLANDGAAIEVAKKTGFVAHPPLILLTKELDLNAPAKPTADIPAV